MTYEKEIEYRIEELWRGVESLLKKAESSGRICAEMLRGKSLPMMTSDLPTISWARISEAIMAIAQLKQIQDTVTQEKFWAKKKPARRAKVRDA